MDFIYRLPRMEDVEDVDKYVPGGYHPVDIGDRIIPDGCDHSESYTVLHKLGHGGFSTVWLVLSNQDERCYALKILTADLPPSQGNDLSILQRLKDDGFEHPNIIQLCESFKVSGPNGMHLCLLLPALGPTLADFDLAKALTPEIRYQTCQQIASGVAALHKKGICHGDLTPSNVAFTLHGTLSMDFPQVCAQLGPMNTERLRLRSGGRSENAPKYVVQRPTFPDFISHLTTSLATARIVDFGEAFHISQPSSTLGVPVGLGYFPPELCFGYPASAASDVWELACLVYQTLGTPPLFPCFVPIFEILVGTVMPFLGPLPAHWRGRFDHERYGYREDGKLQNAEKVDLGFWWDEAKHDKSVRGQMEHNLGPRLSPRQLDFLVDLLEEMLVYEPEKRISAAEVSRRLNSASSMFLEPAGNAEGISDLDGDSQ